MSKEIWAPLQIKPVGLSLRIELSSSHNTLLTPFMLIEKKLLSSVPRKSRKYLPSSIEEPHALEWKILEKQIALVISENKSCADKIKSTFCEDNENTKRFEDAPGNSNFMKLPSPRFLMYIFFSFWSLSCFSKKKLNHKILQNCSYKNEFIRIFSRRKAPSKRKIRLSVISGRKAFQELFWSHKWAERYP